MSFDLSIFWDVNGHMKEWPGLAWGVGKAILEAGRPDTGPTGLASAQTSGA